ncbi:MAG: 3-phosphoshikimate 1-carboxyvinyltransferase [Dehalococcoidales bacterium]|nr:3-phosphoshikimate 1-carboxyvinyltransferase [Dehalococcoidales bacterium]
MKASIRKSKIAGRVVAPSSKSYSIRGLICAALARGESEIIDPLGSDDTEACLDVLGKLGIRVTQDKNSWKVAGGEFRAPDTDLYCRESAATMRFMTAVCALVPGKCRLTTAPSLSRRPIKPLIYALRQLGIDYIFDDEQAQVTIKGGRLKGGIAELPGNISSQFVSALLFISPLADEGTKIRLTTPLESRPFVSMTLECLDAFGVKVTSTPDLREFRTSRQSYQPTRYRVEGDWSSASYLLAMGAMSGEVEVQNLNPESLQGDKAILDFLQEMGADITTGHNSITVKKSRLKAIKADLNDCIDLLPTMAVLAAAADGVSEFTGIERARLKESDRPSALREGLEAMSIKVTEEKKRLIITGSTPKGAVIDTRGDHRIAMAFSLLGLNCGETIIDNAECVAKTYPEFWEILRSIGGEVKINGQ